MNIAVIGAGYVGLVTAGCFAELGNHVVCIDTDSNKINDLKKGMVPIFEPGLATLIQSNLLNGRLQFMHSLVALKVHPQIIFIAVGTPSDIEGSADTQYVLQAAKNIGEYLQQYCVIVDKSTVPVGLSQQLTAVIQAELNKRQQTFCFDTVSNPEFLRQGAAIDDFMRPDRIIIGMGLNSIIAKERMLELYLPIVRHPEKIYFMSIKDAEMTKYAANAILATKISFMNEIAVLCEQMGVDVENVRMGIGSDSRIGNAFIYPGCGYGGSCFPKDVQALIKMAETYDFDPLILRAVQKRNQLQKQFLAEKIIDLFGHDLSNITIGVWGLAFKPETDDLREASSLVLLENLLAHKAHIQAYDPVAIQKARQSFPPSWFNADRLQLVDQQYDALQNADALVLVTEWKPFCYPDFKRMKTLMRRHIIFDGRNQYDPLQMKKVKFKYYGIGR